MGYELNVWLSALSDFHLLSKLCRFSINPVILTSFSYKIMYFSWATIASVGAVQSGSSQPQRCTAKSLQLCLTFCGPTDYGPAGSSAHGDFQTRILEWVAISLSRGSPWPRDRTCVSYKSPELAGRLFTTSATWEVPVPSHMRLKKFLDTDKSVS